MVPLASIESDREPLIISLWCLVERETTYDQCLIAFSLEKSHHVGKNTTCP